MKPSTLRVEADRVEIDRASGIADDETGRSFISDRGQTLVVIPANTLWR